MQVGVGGPLGAWRCMQETQALHSLDQSQSASQGYRFPSSLGASAGGNSEPSQGCGFTSFSVTCFNASPKLCFLVLSLCDYIATIVSLLFLYFDITLFVYLVFYYHWL